MEFSERFGWLALGMAVGFVLGLIVARLRTIEEKVDAVDKHVCRDRDDAGFMRIPLIADVLYLVALVIVVWGAISAQKAINDTEANTDRIGRLAICNTEYLKAQAEFLSIYLEQPPATRPEQLSALKEYYELLEAYATDESSGLKDSPYTNNEALQSCVESDIANKIEVESEK